jgi:hypothetical protein
LGCGNWNALWHNILKKSAIFFEKIFYFLKKYFFAHIVGCLLARLPMTISNIVQMPYQLHIQMPRQF